MGIDKPNDQIQSEAAAPVQDFSNDLQLLNASRTGDNERNEALYQALRHYQETRQQTGQVTFLQMNAQRYATRASAVLVVHTRTMQGKKIALVSALWTETQELRNCTRPVTVGRNGPNGYGRDETWDRPVMLVDVADGAAAQQVAVCVKDHIADLSKVYVVNHLNILLEAKVDGKDADLSTMQDIVFSASDAINAKLIELAGKTQEMARNYVAKYKGKNIVLKTETNPDIVVDINGIPQRTDLSIVATAQTANLSQNQAMAETPRPVVRVDLSVDICPLPQPKPRNINQMAFDQFGRAAQMQPSYVYYAPIVNLLSISPQGDSNSMEDFLIGLASATAFSDNPLEHMAAAWAPRRVHGQQQGAGAVNLRNIGCIGLDLQFMHPPTKDGEPGPLRAIDTSGPEFQADPNRLMRMISEYIDTVPVYQMHIREGGEYNVVNDIIIQAALGDEHIDKRKAAEARIIQSADALTAGRFSALYKAEDGQSMFVHSGVRMPVGYYTAEDNQAYDTRRLDYIALRNLENTGDQTMSSQFLQGMYDNGSLTNMQREHKLHNVQKAACGTARFYDRANIIRVSFAFLAALRQALIQSSDTLSIRLSSTMTSQNDARVRGVPNMDRFVGNFGAGFQHHVNHGQFYGNQGNGNMSMFPGASRW